MEISQLNGNTLVDATFYEYVHTVGAVKQIFDRFRRNILNGRDWRRNKCHVDGRSNADTRSWRHRRGYESNGRI